MNFTDLHEYLRLELLRRIDADALTGSRLAQQTGFRQAHISNFLNRKRALSLDGLDRVLAAQNLTIPQILPPDLLDLHASAALSDESHVESIPLVSSSVAMHDPFIASSSAIEQIPAPAGLLCDIRPRTSKNQAHWQRFLAIRADARQAAAMEPLIKSGSVIILDRHYTSLAPYRSHQLNLYAVRCGSALQIGFVTFDDERLILRPNATAFPVQLIPVRPDQSPTDLIIGRVCLVLNEF